MIIPTGLHTAWRISLFIWIWLSMLIMCSDGLHGQDKQTLLLSHDNHPGNDGLPSSSDLSETLNVKENDDILRVVRQQHAEDTDDDDDTFTKKLARQFRKHRWKLPENTQAVALKNTANSVAPVPTNRTNGIITDLAPLRTNNNNNNNNNKNEDYEDAHNYGQEEDDKSIALVKEGAPVGAERTRTVHADDEELDNLPIDIVKVKSAAPMMNLSGNYLLAENNKESVAAAVDDERGMKKVVDVELFKINNNNNNGRDNDKFRFHADVNKFDGGRSHSQHERIIAQLVNVTTENVYISLESDEDFNEENLKNHSLHTHSSSSFGAKLGIHGNMIKPEASFEEPSIITVNASGIFPVTNLSSVWESQKRKPGKISNHNDERSFSAGDLLANEEGAEAMDEEDDDGGEKTLMMRRRPRRSVVHLYDMVVCATGCNPLIYKGYGCFCGFMGSGITVDGIDKCCYKHDWCYHHAKCPPLLTYFVPYYWTCNAGRPKCVSDFRGWKGICGAHLCECDRQFAECLRKYPCPRSRAMCMTSPWRFWQNVVMPPTYYK